MLWFSYVFYLHTLKSASDIVKIFTFNSQTYFKELRGGKLFIMFTQIFTISVANPSLLMFQVSNVISFLFEELPLALLVELICWQLILLAFFHLRMSLFHLHSDIVFAYRILG